MDLSQIGIKKFLSLLVILLLNQTIYAQNSEIVYLYEVEILNQEYLTVSVSKQKNVSFPQSFKFSNLVPNFYLKESILNEVSDFTISYKGKKKKLEQINNAFEINEVFDFLTYKVKFKKIEANDFPVVQTFAKEDYILLNFANFLGAFDENVIELKVLRDDQILFDEIGVMSSFYSIPLCLDCKKQNVNDKNLDIDIYFNKTEKQLSSFVSEALDAYNILGFNEKLESKTMIFIIDSLNNNEGAIAHENQIVFNFKKLNKYKIQKTILHEIIHWVVPDLQSWLNESVAEFLAIKLLMKSGLITDEKFLDVMAEKMKTADRFKNYSLDDLFRNKTGLSKKLNYQALYSKGAVLAFVLDAKLFDYPDIDISLERYVLKGVSSKNEKLNLNLIQELVKFEKEYTIENKSFSYNMFLNNLGILFEENKVLEIKAKQNIILKKENGDIVIVDNGGINQLEENDVLLKVDRASDFEEIKGKLMEKSEKSSCFVVLRDGIKKNLKISNKESLFIRKKFNLSFLENRTKEQENNWKKYIY